MPFNEGLYGISFVRCVIIHKEKVRFLVSRQLGCEVIHDIHVKQQVNDLKPISTCYLFFSMFTCCKITHLIYIVNYVCTLCFVYSKRVFLACRALQKVIKH